MRSDVILPKSTDSRRADTAEMHVEHQLKAGPNQEVQLQEPTEQTYPSQNFRTGDIALTQQVRDIHSVWMTA